MNLTETMMRIWYDTTLYSGVYRAKFWNWIYESTGEKYDICFERALSIARRTCKKLINLCDYMLVEDMLTEFGVSWAEDQKDYYHELLTGMETN